MGGGQYALLKPSVRGRLSEFFAAPRQKLSASEKKLVQDLLDNVESHRIDEGSIEEILWIKFSPRQIVFRLEDGKVLKASWKIKNKKFFVTVIKVMKKNEAKKLLNNAVDFPVVVK